MMRSQKTSESVVTLDSMDLEDLEGGDGARVLRDKFEAAQESRAPARVDLSDVHAEHRALKKKKRKKKRKGTRSKACAASARGAWGVEPS